MVVPPTSAESLTRTIIDTFDGIHLMMDSVNAFFIYDPDRTLPPERQIPFATLVSNDAYDQVSDLERPDVYRLNISLKKSTFQELFGTEPVDILIARCDFTALDTLMPHPEYGSMWWVCVLNPTTTFDTVMSLLAEAHDRASGRLERRIAEN